MKEMSQTIEIQRWIELHEKLKEKLFTTKHCQIIKRLQVGTRT